MGMTASAGLSANRERVWDRLRQLSELTEPHTPGWTRRVFSRADQEARAVVADWMQSAGLAVTVDAVGNVIGEAPGSASLPSIVSGSHCDTVFGGGRFDGMVGVVGAVEVAQRLLESGAQLEHGFRAVCFIGEEPNPHGISCVGSRAIAGRLSVAHLAMEDEEGVSLGTRMEIAGLKPAETENAKWDPGTVGAFVELHVEQGPQLEQRGVSIGVVKGIAEIDRFRVEVVGRSDHAGTMPMEQRRDALCGAAEFNYRIESRVQLGSGVLTVGQMAVEPGAVNVVPGRVELRGEMRSMDAAWIAKARQSVNTELASVCAQRGLEGNLVWVSEEPAVLCHSLVQSAILSASKIVGEEPLVLPSMAGHDAAFMAGICPMGMIFVPSRDGRSHCAEEWTEPEHVARGIDILCASVEQLDRALVG